VRDQLFRKAALDRLSSQERLDEMLRLTTPRGWLMLLAVFALLGTALLWGIFGGIPLVVSGHGILIRDEGVQSIQSTAGGQVTEILVRGGEAVDEGQVVARVLQTSTGRTIDVVSPHTGRVLEVQVGRGNVIAPGSSLLAVEQAGRPLVGILYLSSIDGRQVQPGMDVQIAPASVRSERYGYLRGRVTAVGEFPSTLQSMRRTLGSDELARSLSVGGAPIQVEVELLRDERTASGFQWTSPSGPPAALQNGTPATANVVLAIQAPIGLAFAGTR
jgi:multidrug efflux pump subunit AcrA (membrane-fusion protein)